MLKASWPACRRLSRLALALSALTVALGAAACGSGSGGAATAAATPSGVKPVLSIGLEAAGPLNPATNNDQTLDSIAYQTITHIEPDGTIGPGLATAWGYVGQGDKVFQFTLRHNARFSDGSPVNAAAVKRWITYFAKAGGPFAPSVPLASVSTSGQWTVRITLSKSNPILPWVFGDVDLWGAIASPKAVDNPKGLDQATDGAGAYTLVPSQTVSNDHYTYVPNKYYYDQSAIKFSKIEVKIIATPTSMLQALQSGQIDVAQGDSSTAPAAVQDGISVAKSPSTTAILLFMNLTKGPLANLRVRQALNYAINRNAITSGLFGTYAEPTSEFVTEDGFDAAGYQNYYPYNPQRAKSLLAAAGYPNGFTLNVTAPSYTGNGGVPMAEAVAKYLQAVGVKLNISLSSTATSALQMMFSGNYGATEEAGGSAPAWYMYAGAWAPDAAYNLGHLTDPVMNQLASAAATAKDPSGYWPKILGRSVTQAYMLPISALDSIWYAKGVSGVIAPRWVQGKPLVSWWSPS